MAEIGNLLMEQRIMVEISLYSGLRCTFSCWSSIYVCLSPFKLYFGPFQMMKYRILNQHVATNSLRADIYFCFLDSLNKSTIVLPIYAHLDVALHSVLHLKL